MSILASLISFIDPTTILIFGTTLLSGIYLKGALWRGRYPPGPIPFPLVGNLPQLASVSSKKKLYSSYVEWSKIYGDVFMLQVGDQRLVIVTGYKRTREALVERGTLFADRPSWLYVLHQIFKGKGILWSNGAEHKDMRKFVAVTLRDLGVGKKSLEERIQDEARLTMAELAKTDGKPFNPKSFLVNAVSNIMCGIVFGNRFEYDDEQFKKLQGLLDFLFKYATINFPENFFPFLRFIPMRSPAKPLIANNEVIKEYVRMRIDEHRETFDPHNVRDIIDLYLKMVAENKTTNTITEENVLRAIEDLFLAGSESTATTLLWIVIYLVRQPDMQRKCQEEIERVVGTGRMVSLADKPNLPYVVATIQECQRLANTIPFTAPHATTEDTELGGYIIPKQSMVLFNIYSIHTDPEYWHNPMEVRPERWLDDQGNLKKFERFMPFSLGPRACLGELLAKMELFIFFSNLIQNFTFKVPPGHTPPSAIGEQPGMTMQPEHFQVIVEHRK